MSDHVMGAAFLQEWPVCRQALLEMMADDAPWQLAFPILACLAVGGEIHDAVPVAAAWSALRHAADLLDAIQDHDQLPTTVITSPARILGCASSLVFAGFQLISSTQSYPGAAMRVIGIFAEAGFDSALGQDLDMDRTSQGPDAENELEAYWQALILKSGSIYWAGAAAGAAVGTEDEDQIQALSEYGTAIGIIRQVLDDCRDVIQGTGSNDFELSLPVLLHSLAGQNPSTWEFANSSWTGGEQLASKQSLLAALQAKQIPTVIADVLFLWQNRALASLEGFERIEPVIALEDIARRALLVQNN